MKKKMLLAGAALALVMSACGGSSSNRANGPGGPADCAKLIDHILQLGLAEKPELRAQAEAKRGDMVDNCRDKIKPTQPQFDCMMAAADMATLNRCE